MLRFTGTVEAIAPIDVAELIAWIGGISFEDWPQQHRLADGGIRPAMVTDPDWFGFKAVSDPVVDQLMEHLPECSAYPTRFLSVVMPGHAIEAHRDMQAPDWICRVHVPLLSNDRSAFVVGGHAHKLEPGMAYRVNTEAEHSVVNDGRTPRIHMMFDLRQRA